MDEAALDAHINELDDILYHQESSLAHAVTYHVYGYSAHFTANDPTLLPVARISAGCFSHCQPLLDPRSIQLKFLLESGLPADPLPDDLSSRLPYAFAGSRLTVFAEPWVRAFGDLGDWSIVAVVSPRAAEAPHFLSRYICDNFALHMLMRSGGPGHVGHLHASTLYRDGRALLLSAPHGVGKSTTALRLMMHGYRLLTDSTTFVRHWPAGTELLGYAIAQLKLRLDQLDEFPVFRTRGRPMYLSGETKMVLDLRQEMPERMLEESVWPNEVVICHMERTSSPATHAEPMTPQDTLDMIWPESRFAGEPEINPSNRMAVDALLRNARCYHLVLGTDVEAMLQAIDNL